ncbi:MAG: UDP-galactopyranose mutase [Mangrovibacterium sp.]
MYDFIIAGAGLYGAVMAYEAQKKGYKCLVIEKREHTGGNIYCREIAGIHVHYYGAHIFHTGNETIWNYVNQFVQFNHYVNSPIACYQGKLYNLPFNMNTFYQLWGTLTPTEAMSEINRQRNKYQTAHARNLEEMALSLVGEDIYYTLIKGYTEKQWGKPASEIPAFIIQRIPLRFTFNNNYFDDPYQGIPIGGYNQLINALLEGTEVRLNTDFLSDRESYLQQARKVIYTGEIDRYFAYCLGRLEYRSLHFEHELLHTESNYQGNAVINYTDAEVPYTRILEHKHFEFGEQQSTVISREYSTEFREGTDPYYPINDEQNEHLYIKYKQLAAKDSRLHFGGRLGAYRYYNMDQVIEAALNDFKIISGQ